MPDKLEALLGRLRKENDAPILLYTIPNFHNPTGVTLSADRRASIVELAHRYNVLIVEDDVYRDLMFSGTVPPSMFACAEGMKALYIGSFFKTLAPGLRLTYSFAALEEIEMAVRILAEVISRP